MAMYKAMRNVITATPLPATPVALGALADLGNLHGESNMHAQGFLKLHYLAGERRWLEKAVGHPGPPASEFDGYDPRTDLSEYRAAILERLDNEVRFHGELMDIRRAVLGPDHHKMQMSTVTAVADLLQEARLFRQFAAAPSLLRLATHLLPEFASDDAEMDAMVVDLEAFGFGKDDPETRVLLEHMNLSSGDADWPMFNSAYVIAGLRRFQDHIAKARRKAEISVQEQRTASAGGAGCELPATFQEAARKAMRLLNDEIETRLRALKPGHRLAMATTPSHGGMQARFFVLRPGQDPPLGTAWTIWGPPPTISVPPITQVDDGLGHARVAFPSDTRTEAEAEEDAVRWQSLEDADRTDGPEDG